MFTVAIIVIFCVILVIYIILRYIYGFWIKQPVFHAYDITYYWYPNRVIDANLPTKNRFTNFKDIQTYLIGEMTENKWALFIEFIQTNFLKNKNNEFHPKLGNVLPYFKNSTKSMISFYTDPETTKVLSVMTSRPINSIIHDISIPLYYVDYLCVKKSHRKKGLAEQMIQTHHYNQRRLNKDIQVSLFKREGELTGIVPLTYYDCYGYFINKFLYSTAYTVNSKYSIVEIGKSNITKFHDYIKQCQTLPRFLVFVYDNHSSILESISTKNIYIYLVVCRETQQVMGMYCLKNACVSIGTSEVITCYSSIKSPDTSEELFYYCFLDVLKKIQETSPTKYGILAVERITDNSILCNKIHNYCRAFVKSPTAYFLYNYISIPVKAERCVILL